mgnify:CR=1 FL=1
MANTLLTIDKITSEALRLAHEKATFLGTINRQFDGSWSNEGSTGDTLRIRLPSQYTRTRGSRVADVQDSEQQNTLIVRATQDHTAMRFNSRELALDLDSFSKLHLQPAMASLISGVESDVLQGVSKLVWNTAGTPGTAITSLTALGAARAKLNQNLAPKDNQRNIQMDSVTMGGLVAGQVAYFNPSNIISENYREGAISRSAMADFYENERVLALTNNTSLTGSLSTYTIVNGDQDLQVSSYTATTAGMVFTIAGVFDCHPETKTAYTSLKQHVVLAGSSSTTISTYPIYITGARKNVANADGTDLTVANVTSAALVFVGSVSTTYTQSLMYHKDAFAFATAELPLMKSAEQCVRKTMDGISLRVWQDGDIRNDELLTRIDILYGYAAIRPQWACRIYGNT